MILANGTTDVEIVITLSAVIPVALTAGLAWWVLRGKRDDPDEKLWRLQDAERRRTREHQNPPE
jgi:hypothetical protein